MDIKYCECGSCGGVIINTREYRKLFKHPSYGENSWPCPDPYAYIVLKGHDGGNPIIAETKTLVLIHDALQEKFDEDYELEEKISSLDTDQEIGNRE